MSHRDYLSREDVQPCTALLNVPRNKKGVELVWFTLIKRLLAKYSTAPACGWSVMEAFTGKKNENENVYLLVPFT